MRILVVDDNGLLAGAAARLLSALGHEASALTRPEDAVAEAASGRWDAVLSDVHMPGMTGPDVMDAVVSAAPAMAGRFVFMTADPWDPAIAERGLSVLEKPFTAAQLRAALAALP